MTKNSNQQHQVQYWRTHISPPLEILDPNKTIDNDLIKLTNINIQNNQKQQNQNKLKNPQKHRNTFDLGMSAKQQQQTLFKIYRKYKPIYQRYNNSFNNTIGKKSYFSSFFYRPQNIKKKSSSVFLSFQQSVINQISTHGLKFNSEFQSGNLFAAYQIKQNQFDLILQNDTNSRGNNQWYYFSISNTKKNQAIKINIVNFYKSHSLYNQGMKPLAYSTIANRNNKGPGWCRYGSGIDYYDSDIKIQNNENGRNYFCLTFEYKFDFDQDTVFFSNCFPYSLSNLNSFFKQITKNENIILIKTIGTSVLKNNIYMIMLGEDIKQKEKRYKISKYIDPKSSIIIMARQHPGQTPGSFVCQGFVKSLLQQNIQAKFLLSHFNFFIFPMINIDGVINGNYRGNAYGVDLNRIWRKQRLQYHPQVHYIKNQIRKIAKRSNIHLILDFHGHSKKLNSFFFGNVDKKDPNKPQIFPMMASKASPHISFKNSTFSEDQDKQCAARIVLKQQLKSHKDCQIYTFEASFYGTIRNGKKVHFTIDSYKDMGKVLVETIYKKQYQNYKQIKLLKESILIKQITKQIQKINKSDLGRLTHPQGSDSEIDQDQIQQFIIENLNSQEYPLTEKKQSIKTFNSVDKSVNTDIIGQKTRSNRHNETNIYLNSYNSQKKQPRINKQIRFQPIYEHDRKNKTLNKNASQQNDQIQNQRMLKQYLMSKMGGTQNFHDKIKSMFKMDKFLAKNDIVFLKTKQTKLESIYTPKHIYKDHSPNFYNFSGIQKKKKQQQDIQKIQMSNYRLQKQRRNTLNPDNSVNQMIKIRKINYRIKACTSSFREQFLVQKDKN